MSKSTAEIDWKSAEQIVAVIEKAITPHATVQHNVMLPVIGSSRTRQCDVVITFGDPPRQSIAIVEVQNRGTKPEINTFHGWLAKMREVGAQQLFCVSALGYPESIVEVATQIGPTVRLLTLDDLAGKERLGGVFIVPWFIQTTPRYKILEVGQIKIDRSSDLKNVQLNSASKSFSEDGTEPSLSLDDMVCMTLNNSAGTLPSWPFNQAPRTITIELAGENKEEQLWFHQGNDKALIKRWVIKVQISDESRSTPIPVTNFAYRQELEGGTLAWVGCTKLQINGMDQEICTVFRPNQEGLLTATATYLRPTNVAGG
jgi:hypothetical protein